MGRQSGYVDDPPLFADVPMGRRSYSLLSTAAIVLSLILPFAYLGRRALSVLEDRASTEVMWMDPIVVVIAGVATVVLGMLALPSLSQRPWPLVPTVVQRGAQRLFEISFFGVGSLSDWTWSSPDVGLGHLNTPISIKQIKRATSQMSATSPTGEPSGGHGGNAAQPAQPRSVPQAPSPGVETRAYTVARGDTYWSLAESIFGDGSRWAEIQELNIGLGVEDGVFIDTDSTLRRGWTILVPVKEGSS